MSTTETKTARASWEVREAFDNVLFAFAQDPKLSEKGPGAFLYGVEGEPLWTYTFGETAEEPVLYDNLLKARADTGRAVFKKGKTREGLYVSLLSRDGVCLVFFGWTWNDGLAFLIAFAKQLKLEVPSQASLSLPKLARDALPEAVRALL
jgi:hypothetical protein